VEWAESEFRRVKAKQVLIWSSAASARASQVTVNEVITQATIAILMHIETALTLICDTAQPSSCTVWHNTADIACWTGWRGVFSKV
jgi:hypothetical protein